MINSTRVIILIRYHLQGESFLVINSKNNDTTLDLQFLFQDFHTWNLGAIFR